ncbi:MAG: hypothetical protein HFH61_00570 [Lachnospiraceae bacterium]|nr:hypothetical protein [Lachnospiraceae bacterium]
MSYTLKVLFILYQIPVSMTLCMFGRDKMLKFWLLEMIYWINICIVAHTFNRSNKTVSISFGYSRLPIKYIRIILVVILATGIAMSIRSLGTFNFSISLSGVYDFRRYYKENSNDLITFFKSALGAFLGPTLITYYVYKRKIIPAIFFVIIQIIFFSMARDKTYLFLLPIAILLGIFGDGVVSNIRKYMSYMCMAISGFSLLAALNIFRTIIFELLIRRMFVVPAFLNYIYFFFFDSNEPIWWRQDTFLIDKPFTPVYSESVPLVIANRMLNGRETNPNAGMFAEAYSRCGIFGIIIYPLLVILMLRLVDKCFKNAPAITKITLACCLAVFMGNDVITSTSFVCTVVLMLFGSTYFRERDASLSKEYKIGERL